jgi:hypothetical protein
MKLIKHNIIICVVSVVSYFFGFLAFSAVNSQFSLELKVEPSVEANVAQLVNARLTAGHGFSNAELTSLIHDLAVLASINGGKPSVLFSQVFTQLRDFSGAGLFQWIIGGIRQFRASQGMVCSNLSEQNFNACSILNTQTVVLSPAHFQNDRLKRILTLIHERRPFDGYDHIPNTPSYDKEIRGTRGAQLSFLTSLVNSCSNCTIIAKQDALNHKAEILAALKNLSNTDQSLLNEELQSVQNPMPSNISQFLAELKTQTSCLTVTHFECKNGVPLYLYQQQNKILPNVNSQDCFTVYYKAGVSPSLGAQFPEGKVNRFGALFIFTAAGGTNK